MIFIVSLFWFVVFDSYSLFFISNENSGCQRCLPMSLIDSEMSMTKDSLMITITFTHFPKKKKKELSVKFKIRNIQ